MAPPNGLLSDIPPLEAVDTTNPLPAFVEREVAEVEPPPVITTAVSTWRLGARIASVI